MSRKLTVRSPKLYSVWNNMHQRCENPNCKSYKNYGARGITVCDEWEKYPPFYDWAMSHGYREGLSIERYDVNDKYCPDNCTWIPQSEQPKNRRLCLKNKYIRLNGKYKSYTEWAEALHIKPSVFSDRVRRYDGDEASIISGKRRTRWDEAIRIDRKTKPLRYWLEYYNVSRETYLYRRSIGMTEKKALTYKHRIDREITIDGETKRLEEWLKCKNISLATYKRRISEKGMTPEQALTHKRYSRKR